MNIKNQNIYGGNQQFADQIINAHTSLTEADKNLIQFVIDHQPDKEKQNKLFSAMNTLKQSNAKDEEKKEAKSTWKHFIETGLDEIAKETVKGIISGSIWAAVISYV